MDCIAAQFRERMDKIAYPYTQHRILTSKDTVYEGDEILIGNNWVPVTVQLTFTRVIGHAPHGSLIRRRVDKIGGDIIRYINLNPQDTFRRGDEFKHNRDSDYEIVFGLHDTQVHTACIFHARRIITG